MHYGYFCTLGNLYFCQTFCTATSTDGNSFLPSFLTSLVYP
ncbi:hypothetical protein MGSAQ_001718 [marine sediment metagenome]|uniref:Uncharacterized protein n=1 Tax=marine sediment metagenome TaxID=412755 RepID=A0A1B6NVK3_9ZZZZ